MRTFFDSKQVEEFGDISSGETICFFVASTLADHVLAKQGDDAALRDLSDNGVRILEKTRVEQELVPIPTVSKIGKNQFRVTKNDRFLKKTPILRGISELWHWAKFQRAELLRRAPQKSVGFTCPGAGQSGVHVNSKMVHDSAQRICQVSFKFCLANPLNTDGSPVKDELRTTAGRNRKNRTCWVSPSPKKWMTYDVNSRPESEHPVNTHAFSTYLRVLRVRRGDRNASKTLSVHACFKLRDLFSECFDACVLLANLAPSRVYLMLKRLAGFLKCQCSSMFRRVAPLPFLD